MYETLIRSGLHNIGKAKRPKNKGGWRGVMRWSFFSYMYKRSLKIVFTGLKKGQNLY